MLEIQTLSNLLNAELTIPGSKSITNRALIIASLAEGKSVIKNALESDDTIYLREGLNRLGVKIEIKNGDIIVHGRGGKFDAPKEKIFVGNAGTAMRFLTALSSLVPGKVIVTGNERMQTRPIGDLLLALNQLGISAISEKRNGCPPIIIHGSFLSGGKIEIKGDVSSQFLSAILMIAPLAKHPISIRINGELVSKSYADLTSQIMTTFGAEIKNDNYQWFSINNTRLYQTREFIVEADASSATYFLAAAAITGGKIKILNWNPHSVQGDTSFVDVLIKMGCKIQKTTTTLEIIGPKKLSPLGKIDLNSMPDAVPTLAITAAFCAGYTEIRNVANLRVKETDRIKALVTELNKIGATAKELPDGLEIIGNPDKLHGAEIETYDDHRIAMSFAIAGLKIPEIKIKNPACVNKSFPEFWEKLKLVSK